MAILKLQQAGESATFRVKSAAVTEGKFGPQVKFESEDGDLLYISQETAERQLARIPLAVEDCAGETLTFSRDPNKSGGAPYWGIRVAGAGSVQAAPSAGRVASPYAGGPPPNDPLPFDLPADEGHGADPVAHLPTRPSPEAQRTAPNSAKRAAICDDYLALLSHVRKTMPDLTHDAAQAAAATIFIAWDKAGVR